jgi:hypothetical protein
MMPRWVWLSFVAVALAAVTLVLTDGPLTMPGVTPANVARVKEGMTLEEVEALMGRRGRRLISEGGADNWSDCYCWEGVYGEATVLFQFTAGQPVGRAHNAMFHPRGGPFTRLRDWLSR